MSRVIKVRAWDIQKKKMFYNVAFDIINSWWHRAGTYDGTEPGKGLIKIFHGSPIMQFTGLKDKDGVEIYVGDIIKLVEKSNNGRDHTAIYIMRLKDCDCIYFEMLEVYNEYYRTIPQPEKWVKEWNRTGQRGKECTYDYFGRISEKYEVIGNIHHDSHLIDENPELLEPTNV